jgi:ligand-binding sensor domain-containing protein
LNKSRHQIEDTPFQQKSASHAILPGGRHPNDIRALVTTPDGVVWIGTADGLFTTSDQGFTRVEDVATGCPDIKCVSVADDGSLLVGTGHTLAERDSKGTWSILLDDTWDDGAITAAARNSDRITIATSHRGPLSVVGDSIQPLSDLYPSGERVFCIVSSRDSTSILGEAGVTSSPPDLSALRSHELKEHQVRDLCIDGTITYFATSDGLYKAEAGSAIRHVETPVRDLHSVCRTSLGIT